MTLGRLREELAKLAHLHPLTHVNCGDVQPMFGKVILEIDSPELERMESAVEQAEAGERCAEHELAVAEETVARLQEENRKLREIVGRGP